MNADLGTWDVAKVTSLESTFLNAAMFMGGGLDSWNTSDVTNLYDTFYKASSMNADLGAWDVGKVEAVATENVWLYSKGEGGNNGIRSLWNTFKGAAKFKATGLEKWTLPNSTFGSKLRNLFDGAISIPACTKWLIIRNWPSHTKVRTVYSTWDSYCEPDIPSYLDPPPPSLFDACMAKKVDEGKGKCQVR